MTPDFTVSADGLDVTDRFAGRKIELEVVDATGTESDSAEIVIFDPQAVVQPPRRGAILSIALGYRETGLIPQGLFKVDQVKFKGYPHKIQITANAADNKQMFKERRTKDYTNKTLGEIVQEIAGRHGLQGQVAADLASVKFPLLAGSDQSYIGQHEESDAAFLTRVAESLGGFMSPKNGRLLVARRGDGKSMSGAAGLVMIRPEMLLDREAYEVSLKDKPIHGEVEASYFDRGKVAREPVVEGGGDGGVAFRFRNPFPSRKQAEDAAKGKVRELQRGEGSATFNCWGDATIRAEMDLVATGIRSGVDGVRWTIERVTHRLDDSRGFTSRIECETKPK
jgi:phage protein D